jgi:hypothetical protein
MSATLELLKMAVEKVPQVQVSSMNTTHAEATAEAIEIIFKKLTALHDGKK